MMDYEIIDRLCSVTELMAGLVRDQASVIAQCDIPEETRMEYDRRRDEIATELDLVEYRLRRVRREEPCDMQDGGEDNG